MKPSSSRNKRWGAVFLNKAVIVLFAVTCSQSDSRRHSKNYLKNLVLNHFRKPTTTAKHTGLNESDASAESENEGATSDNPSDSNTGSACKGMDYGGTCWSWSGYCWSWIGCWFWDKFLLFLSLGTLVMRPAGNDNKGAMKLRVDFKQKHTGKFVSLSGNYTCV